MLWILLCPEIKQCSNLCFASLCPQAKNSDFFKQYVTEDFSRYLNRKRCDQCHGNHIEMQAMCELFNRPLEVFQYSTGASNLASALTVTDLWMRFCTSLNCWFPVGNIVQNSTGDSALRWTQNVRCCFLHFWTKPLQLTVNTFQSQSTRSTVPTSRTMSPSGSAIIAMFTTTQW